MRHCRSKRRSGASGARSNTATATTATADTGSRGYVGRFAPSPSGDLHLGSLYTAAASYLDARANAGRWLVRVEDLDTPRVVPGAATRMLRTLEAFGFEWQDEVVLQSQRVEQYVSALERLGEVARMFECNCSRALLADEDRYPGHCRDRALPFSLRQTATRLRVEAGSVQFADRIQGIFRQDVAAAVGDFVLRRRDGVYAYVLAVVVDDAAQHITHVVRGADLLDNTPRQIHLLRLLGCQVPAYAHVPVLVEPNGAKLAKSARSVRLDPNAVQSQLLTVFRLLGLSPPHALVDASLSELWTWAVSLWSIKRVPHQLSCRLDAKFA